MTFSHLLRPLGAHSLRIASSSGSGAAAAGSVRPALRLARAAGLSLAAAAPLYTCAPLLRADDGANTARSASSSLWREASPLAMRRQPVHLVFMTREGEGRDKWKSWVGYFRDAGYDCQLLNIAVEGGEATVERLGEELTAQLRLAATQRQPLLLVRGDAGSEVALAQVAGSDPRISGLIVVGAEQFDGEGRAPKKLRVLVVPHDADEKSVKDVERWMISQGYS